ncbi:T-complex protein 1 subunit gamma, putative [Entamoeba invadens IP1]|uniref:T-complex protein 1 subunit gamma, putative n=1 Tax=Entamoeba invadens IP1 TaxID=370355 RepID=UPI0002C3ED7E|nr:T-complex protein 1 subunit gamma, putative [Entamoeba invadens IP1]ELP90769.1 T-complex protein 1 subunit gamma, putative [Entamoeba invadens IP1]|eukprot:XP_004257540.1 T-complex protein 1 subunit gamma, putative [Entamoeba invadens IP1]
MNAPVLVLNTNTKRENGRKAQLANIMAGKTVADIIRTCLGPKSMLKMLIDPTAGVTITSDGNSVLRDLVVEHPAAKYMIELSRSQDETVGDGTTSVVILCGEVLQVAEPWIQKGIHPTIIISGFLDALEDALKSLQEISITIDLADKEAVRRVVKSSIGTTFMNTWNDILCSLAIDAVTVCAGGDLKKAEGQDNIDTKRYARVEKIPGGDFSESEVVKGVVLNKDVVHSKMSRRIEHPRVVLLDCNLEYTKGESQTDVEVTNATDFGKLLELEEQFVKKQCDEIIRVKPDLVITEKGISDIAQHYLQKAGITALRRARKNDNLRLARATGATVVSRTEELNESHVGVAGMFEVKKIGDEYYSYIHQCENSTACTIVLRGGSKDVLNEVERNLQDAMAACRNLVEKPKLVPGGGASEMHVATKLTKKAKNVEGKKQWPYSSIAIAMEVIPRTLAANCGVDVVKVVTELRAKHLSDEKGCSTFGIDGMTGSIVDMKDLGVWEPYEVKAQCIKTAIEAACTLLRVDDVVSGIKNPQGAQQQQQNQMAQQQAMMPAME